MKNTNQKYIEDKPTGWRRHRVEMLLMLVAAVALVFLAFCPDDYFTVAASVFLA